MNTRNSTTLTLAFLFAFFIVASDLCMKSEAQHPIVSWPCVSPKPCKVSVLDFFTSYEPSSGVYSRKDKSMVNNDDLTIHLFPMLNEVISQLKN
ncbi:hypothetical protein MTR_5g082560 [Medicago truncatula]|uniref:Transmembrane protein n=1 Tax=Medicago truncatula TaxID=3880 RepID=G7KH06_MEDTR|nr:hypothetical protein MTR_5g082560 [Medicago truncatula]